MIRALIDRWLRWLEERQADRFAKRMARDGLDPLIPHLPRKQTMRQREQLSRATAVRRLQEPGAW